MVLQSYWYNTYRNITYWKFYNTTTQITSWEQKTFNYGFSMSNFELVKAGIDNYLQTHTHSYTSCDSTACNVCGLYRAPVAHNYITVVDSQYHWQECTKCGKLNGVKTLHNYTTMSNTSATCTTSGYKVERCQTCNFEKQTTIPALGHSAGSAATCTAAQVCVRYSQCNYTYQNALGHTKGTLKSSVSPTCTSSGSNTYKCGRDSSHDWGTETVAALGHSAGSAATCTAAQVCVRYSQCNYTYQNALGHQSSSSWSKNASTHWKSCVRYSACGYKFSESAHSYGTGTSCTSGCGQTHSHAGSTTWSYDSSNHWKNCTVAGCSAKVSIAMHTIVNNGCSTCKYLLSATP